MNDTEPHFRWQFSLRALLVSTAFVALAVSLWQTSQRLSRTTTELESLRNEVGHLTVEDENLAHAINVPHEGRYAWRWRLHLPSGSRYQLKVAHGELANFGIPEERTTSQHHFSSKERHGQSVFTVKLAKNAEQEWKLDMLWDRDYMDASIDSTWLDDFAFTESMICAHQETETFEANEPIVLLRFRGNSKNASPEQTKKPGFLVWLEPVLDK